MQTVCYRVSCEDGYLAPVNLPRVKISLILWLEEKKPCVPNASSPCFVYSCTSLMNDSLKSHRFSLCPVQGKMSCFLPSSMQLSAMNSIMSDSVITNHQEKSIQA